MRMIFPPRELAEIWFEKGKARQELHQYSEALESYNTSLETYSDYEDALKSKEKVIKLIKK